MQPNALHAIPLQTCKKGQMLKNQWYLGPVPPLHLFIMSAFSLVAHTEELSITQNRNINQVGHHRSLNRLHVFSISTNCWELISDDDIIWSSVTHPVAHYDTHEVQAATLSKFLTNPIPWETRDERELSFHLHKLVWLLREVYKLPPAPFPLWSYACFFHHKLLVFIVELYYITY